MKYSGILCFALALLLNGVVHGRKNVLFLVADDMRPELGCYLGEDFPSPVHPSKIHSPNLDALASKSALLKRAYVQQAVCSPSRTSLLTGRRPDTTHVYDLEKYFRDVGGNYTTIPQYFKEQGYRSVGMGKIFHPGHASDHDDPISWSEPYYHPPYLQYWDGNKNASWRGLAPEEYEEKHLPDNDTANYALETLSRLAPKASSGEQPFFLAVGFHRPHLPFVVPREFLDLYPDVQLPPNPYAPYDMPDIAWSAYGELRSYNDIKVLNASGVPNTTLPDDVVKDLRRAYYSALSYTDYLIGKVLAHLDTLGLNNSTIISFWGDHGWQLGEHGEWAKHTNFELATHAPMMIHVPGETDKGIVIEKLTEFVDLYPTLAEAAGLEVPPLCPMDNATKVPFCREGESIMPLIKDPMTPWKDAAFSQYPRGPSIMGYSIRTDMYRYTEWVGFNYTTYKPIWEKVVGVELYDHLFDPEENRNGFEDPYYYDIRRTLSKMLRYGWRHALSVKNNNVAYARL